LVILFPRDTAAVTVLDSNDIWAFYAGMSRHDIWHLGVDQQYPPVISTPTAPPLSQTSACTATQSKNQCKVDGVSGGFCTGLTTFGTVDNTWTDVLSAVWSERNHQRQYHGEHRAGATQHPSVVPIITLIGNGSGGCFVSKKLSGDSAFEIV
jgi:hypothetical protein